MRIDVKVATSYEYKRQPKLPFEIIVRLKPLYFGAS
jgi:hypothetical protein